MKRTCCLCKEEKEITQFAKDKHDSTGYTYSCKVCRRIRHAEWRKKNPERIRELNIINKPKRKEFYDRPENKIRYNLMRIKREFGLEAEDYLKLVEEQDGKCFICGKPETCKKNKNLSVDHCHTTGKIRGLLCNRCNRGIGLFEDDTELLQNAIKYLKR